MNAAASRVETKVMAEDRIARIESDVAEIKDDVKTVNIRLNESIIANAKEFGAVRAEIATLRTETEKNFGAVRAEIATHRTEAEKNFGAVRAELAMHRTETEKSFGALHVETEKNFGSVRLEIEKVRTSIVSAKLWLVLFCIGSLGSLLMSILNFISHTSRVP
jgi:hypothetical protein